MKPKFIERTLNWNCGLAGFPKEKKIYWIIVCPCGEDNKTFWLTYPMFASDLNLYKFSRFWYFVGKVQERASWHCLFLLIWFQRNRNSALCQVGTILNTAHHSMGCLNIWNSCRKDEAEIIWYAHFQKLSPNYCEIYKRYDY